MRKLCKENPSLTNKAACIILFILVVYKKATDVFSLNTSLVISHRNVQASHLIIKPRVISLMSFFL